MNFNNILKLENKYVSKNIKLLCRLIEKETSIYDLDENTRDFSREMNRLSFLETLIMFPNKIKVILISFT